MSTAQPPTTRRVACPSCGADREIRNPAVASFACEYCGAVVLFDEERAKAAGEQSVLPEGFSRLYTGATGSYHRQRFRVLGRVRLGWSRGETDSRIRGFWDEWYLEMERGGITWLTDDDHELAVQERVDPDGAGPFPKYRPGVTLRHGDETFVVQETGTATVLGVEGEVTEPHVPGERFDYVDASSRDGRHVLGIEYDDDPPSVFLGRWLRHAELALDDEGDDW